jgi:serine/threonine protein phosphatase 1
MLDWLFKSFAGGPDRPAPPQHEIFAVGDIHGCYDPLCDLLKNIRAASVTARPEIIFLGDYIDRGPKSRDVIDLLSSVEMSETFSPVFLKGNHEATLLDFLEDPSVGPSWLQYGGAETLMSYGVTPPRLKGDEPGWIEASRALRERLPESHLQFFEKLDLCADRGLYFFAHAGIDPDRPIEAQRESDLLWIRDAFLNDNRRLERIIVHGHTPQDAPSKDQRRIGLDLGGYQTGRLAAAHILGEDVTFITSDA